jgi:hypothetical protein
MRFAVTTQSATKEVVDTLSVELLNSIIAATPLAPPVKEISSAHQ